MYCDSEPEINHNLQRLQSQHLNRQFVNLQTFTYVYDSYYNLIGEKALNRRFDTLEWTSLYGLMAVL